MSSSAPGADRARPTLGHTLLDLHVEQLLERAATDGPPHFDRGDVEASLLTQLDAHLSQILRVDPEAAAALLESTLTTERGCQVTLLVGDVLVGETPDTFERRLFAAIGIDPSAWDAPAELADDAPAPPSENPSASDAPDPTNNVT